MTDIHPPERINKKQKYICQLAIGGFSLPDQESTKEQPSQTTAHTPTGGLAPFILACNLMV